MKWHILNRKAHRWGAIIVALPFLIVILSGLLLQVKKEFEWIQPPTQKGQGKTPTLPNEQLLEVVRAVPEAEVNTWSDIDRLDIRIKDGVTKVQCKNRYEIQVDFQTGELLQVAYRRSDWIESFHDGSGFADSAKLYIFLPAAVVVLGLWFTGIYLFILPYWVKWRRKKPNHNVTVSA